MQFGEVTDKQATIFVDSHGMSVDFAKAGTGMALASSLICSPCIAEGSLVQLHTATMPAQDGYFIEALEGRHFPIARKFTQWMLNEAREAESVAFNRSALMCGVLR